MRTRRPGLGFLVFVVVMVLAAIALNGAVSRITGFAVMASGPSNLTFLPPTPQNGSVVNAPFVVVNISADEDLSLAVLSFGDQNVTMTRSGRFAWAFVNATGVIPMVAYALNDEGLASNSQERLFIMGYVNWSPIGDRSIMEEGRLDIDLWSFVHSIKSKSDLGFAVGQDRSDIVSCGLSGARFLNCTTLPQASGSTAVTVVGDDGSVSSTVTFDVTVEQVNDPPTWHASIPSQSLTTNQVGSIDLSRYVKDPESDSMNFLLRGGSGLPVLVSGQASVTIQPNSTSVGSYNVSIIANDSMNASSSNAFTIAVTSNQAPTVVSRLTGLVLNGSKAYRLRLLPLFSDPDGDDLAFVAANLTIAKLVREGSVLYLVPFVNASGNDVLKIVATDGLASVTFALPVTVFSSGAQGGAGSIVASSQDSSFGEGSNQPDVGDQQTSDQSPVSSKVGSAIPAKRIVPGSTIAIDLSSYLDLSRMDPMTVRIFPKGLRNILLDHVDGFTVTLSSRSGWSGSEKVQFMVTDRSSHVLSNEFEVSVGSGDPSAQQKEQVHSSTLEGGSAPGPVLRKPIPSIFFDENKTSITLDMSQYFEDPAGNGVEYLIEPKEGLKTEIHGRNIAVISLAGPGSPVRNESIRVIAKDSLGNIATADVVVNAWDAFSQAQDSIDVVLQSLIAIMLVVVIALVYVRQYGGPQRPPSLRSGWGAIPPDHGLFKEALSHWISRVSPPKLSGEPPELRREALLIKEGSSALRAIASSSKDKLVSAALGKEHERLKKALVLMDGKARLSRQEMKRLALYVKEVASALEQIRDLTEDYLIYQELHRVEVRMKALAKDLEIKLGYMGEFPRFG